MKYVSSIPKHWANNEHKAYLSNSLIKRRSAFILNMKIKPYFPKFSAINRILKLLCIISMLSLLSTVNLSAEKSARHALQADVASKLGELTAEDINDLKARIDGLTANLTLADASELTAAHVETLEARIDELVANLILTDKSELTAAYVEGLEARIDELEPAVGDYKISAESADHDGWLLCDGREEDKDDYPELFTAITNSFSKNNDKFKLPDAKGRVLGIIGQGKDDQDEDLTPRFAGNNPGYETHTLTIEEMPSHNHEVLNESTPDPLMFDGSSSGIVWNHNGTAAPGYFFYDVHYDLPLSSKNTGGTAEGNTREHNIMQPTLFLGNLFIYAGEQNDAGQ